MVQVVGLSRQVGSEINAGKLFEIVDEMCLIEVAAGQRYFGPVNVVPAPYDLQHLLKPLNTAE